MKKYLTILIVFVFALDAGAQILKKSTCYSIKRDSIASDLFWKTFNRTYETLRSDVANINIAWVKVPHGSNKPVLKKITISKNGVFIRDVVDDHDISESFFLCDFQININIFTLADNIEKGYYSVACTNWDNGLSTNAYFIFEKGNLIFTLFAGMSNLSEIPRLDKTLFLNAATLIESMVEMEKH